MKKVAKFSPIAERPTNDDGQLEALTRHLQSRRKSEKRVHRKVSVQFKSDRKRWQQLLSSTASSSTGLVHELPALSNPTWAVHRSSLTEGSSGVETNIVHMMTKLHVGTPIQVPSHPLLCPHGTCEPQQHKSQVNCLVFELRRTIPISGRGSYIHGLSMSCGLRKMDSKMGLPQRSAISLYVGFPSQLTALT